MIDQLTILGFPITPWFIIFFVCLIAVFVGIIMLARDIKKKDYNIGDDDISGKSDFSDSFSSVTDTESDKTEWIYGTTGTIYANRATSSNIKTSGIYDDGKTSSVFKNLNSESFENNKTEGFGPDTTTAFGETEGFFEKTETINQAEYTGRIMYCSRCGSRLDGGCCPKCKTKI